MVEGHGVHRTARAHQLLVGQRLEATSPNGRFNDGASQISNQFCTKVEAIGKNLFLWFNSSSKHAPSDAIVVHVHFGMSGQFATTSSDKAPQVKPTTRLVLKSPTTVSMVSCQTLDHGDEQFYKEWAAKLGPDPLRDDADPERFYKQCQATKKAIGLMLMTQEAIAGVGNIYRAEILFKARIHPLTPSNSLSRAQFDLIWMHSVECLQRGFTSGSILTVDPADAAKLGAPWTRRYIYNHSECGFCKSSIQTFPLAGRRCYVCETCQPLSLPSPSHKPKPAKKFVSHCAPDDGDLPSTRKRSVAQLKQKPIQHKLDKSDPPKVKAGSSQLPMISAKDAMQEKLAAGEKRNVEHVALVHDPVQRKKRTKSLQ